MTTESKSSVENVSKLEKKLSFQVPAAKVTTAFEKAYKDIQKNVEIKGFRKGKVPLDKVKTLYKDHAQSNVIQDLVEENFFKALDEHNLDPINQPHLKLEQELAEDKDFHFSLTFEVHPEIELKKYQGLEVKKEKIVIDEDQVHKSLENLRKGQAQSVPVLEDRAAKTGDIAVVDFEGFVDGKPLENGKGENHPLELGANTFIPGFEEAVIGMKPGITITANLKFPDEYHAPDIAGKPVQFKITLKQLKKNELPEVNDEFAKKVGFDTVPLLKEAILTDFKNTEEKRIQEDFKNRLLRELTKSNPIDVPATLVQKQKEGLVEDMNQRMSQMGMTPDQLKDYVQKWEKDFTETATFIVQSSYLVNKIAEKENLKANDADLKKKVDDYVRDTGIEAARLTSIYEVPENRRRLLNTITEEKVIDFLTQKAKVTEVSKEKLDA